MVIYNMLPRLFHIKFILAAWFSPRTMFTLPRRDSVFIEQLAHFQSLYFITEILTLALIRINISFLSFRCIFHWAYQYTASPHQQSIYAGFRNAFPRKAAPKFLKFYTSYTLLPDAITLLIIMYSYHHFIAGYACYFRHFLIGALERIISIITLMRCYPATFLVLFTISSAPDTALDFIFCHAAWVAI